MDEVAVAKLTLGAGRNTDYFVINGGRDLSRWLPSNAPPSRTTMLTVQKASKSVCPHYFSWVYICSHSLV